MSIFDKLNQIPDTEPDEIDLKMLASAKEHENDPTRDYEEIKEAIRQKEKVEKFILRLPKSLGEQLRAEANEEGVSLNQYLLMTAAFYAGYKQQQKATHN